MIVENAISRLKEAIEESDKQKSLIEVKFIYNELNDSSRMGEVFEWLFKNSRPFSTRYDEYRFVIVINPNQ